MLVRVSYVVVASLFLFAVACGDGEGSSVGGSESDTTAPGEDTAAAVDVDEDTLAGDATFEDTGAQDAHAEDTAPDDTVADDSAVEDALTEDTLADDSAVEDTLAGDTADGDTADGDTADGDTADGDTADGDTVTCVDCPPNHPCAVAATPRASDEAVTSCVCAKDDYCCTTAWDETCVALAQSACAVVCDCTAGSACSTGADCAACGGDVCTGTFACVAGGCAQGAPLVCPDADEADCLSAVCDAAAGGCAVIADSTLCNDGDPCSSDFCDPELGTCSAEPVFGCPGGDACVVHGPGATDAAVMACVCTADDYCCTSAWDSECVALAKGACGHACDCSKADPSALPCQVDADCMGCAADLCTSPWACVDGACEAAPAVVCDITADTACAKTVCDDATGACEVLSGDALCDDQNSCTTDVCVLQTGACIHEDAPLCGKTCGVDVIACSTDADCAPCATDLCKQTWSCLAGACAAKAASPCVATGCDVATCEPSTGACAVTALECGTGHACTAKSTGGVSDPTIAGCVCAIDPFCCTTAWDAQCVALGVLSCGASCDCAADPAAHPCATDADCGYCGESHCGTPFACIAGLCTAPPEVCPSAPAFICHGADLPAADGCTTVTTSAGCCDTFDRVVWCSGGKTFCIDCAASKIPTCGWSDASGFYDCATDGAEESTGALPKACAP